MKFKNYLETISGVSIYPMITLLMFFIFFSALLIWVVRSGKQMFNDVSKLPLDIEDAINEPLSTNS